MNAYHLLKCLKMYKFREKCRSINVNKFNICIVDCAKALKTKQNIALRMAIIICLQVVVFVCTLYLQQKPLSDNKRWSLLMTKSSID